MMQRKRKRQDRTEGPLQRIVQHGYIGAVHHYLKECDLPLPSDLITMIVQWIDVCTMTSPPNMVELIESLRVRHSSEALKWCDSMIQRSLWLPKNANPHLWFFQWTDSSCTEILRVFSMGLGTGSVYAGQVVWCFRCKLFGWAITDNPSGDPCVECKKIASTYGSKSTRNWIRQGYELLQEVDARGEYSYDKVDVLLKVHKQSTSACSK